jgi:hypothetical protein
MQTAAIKDFRSVQSSEDFPDWSRLQQELIVKVRSAAKEFVKRYTRPDGTLFWRSEWPGMDGSDDPYEAFQYFALFYAFTGDDEVYELAQKMWDSITWQWTEYGQIHREFDGYYDWMHHGEANLFHYFFGLTKPESLKDRTRAVRFANLYNGRDPSVENYDADLKLIRSPQTGSRGPRLEVTQEDLSTHRGVLDDYPAPFEDMQTSPFELGTCNWSNDAVFDEVVRLMNERTTRGDVPLNLNATGQMAHAFMYTGDPELQKWVLDYLHGWHQRALDNEGIIPDNVGLTGKVGEYLEGKWWGGHYGWRWPHGFLTIIEPIVNACSNAYLLTGDASHLALAREQLDYNYALGKWEEGHYLTPHKHLDAGWSDYRISDPFHAIHLWARSLADEDAERIERCRGEASWRVVSHPTKPFSAKHYNVNTIPWYEYIRGNFDAYPEEALAANHNLVDQQLTRMRSSQGDPRVWDTLDRIDNYPDSRSMQVDGYAIHAWQEFCPVYFEALVQLQWGSPMHISHGGFQHATLRYYCAERRTPGLPSGVSALITSISTDSVSVEFVNPNADFKTIVIQGGAFGEHEILSVKSGNDAPQSMGERSRWVEVSLPPRSVSSLIFEVERYCRQPSYETPWSSQTDWGPLIVGRK